MTSPAQTVRIARYEIATPATTPTPRKRGEDNIRTSQRWSRRAAGAALTAAAAALPLATSAAAYTITANLAGGHANAWLNGLLEPDNSLGFYLLWGLTGMIAGLFAIAVIHQRGRGATYGLAEMLLDHPLFPILPAALGILLAAGFGHLDARSAL